jgi:tetratricopeptide (TPR) repeat protein
MINVTKGNHFLVVLAAAIFAVTLFIHHRFERPDLQVSKQETAINVDNTFLQMLAAGNKRLLADVIWIFTLLESDLEKYQKKDAGDWMFLRFQTIANLDPLFYENYLYGGQYLSIVKDDLEGASVIYERGIEKYPNDFALNLNAGFNYYFELGNYEAGLRLLDKIKDNPKAPVTLPSIVNKLKLETGTDPEAIFLLVYDRYQKTHDEFLKEKLYSDLYSIRAEIDLNCLNAGKANCHKQDLEGSPYIRKSDGHFHANKPFLNYRLKKKRI